MPLPMRLDISKMRELLEAPLSQIIKFSEDEIVLDEGILYIENIRNLLLRIDLLLKIGGILKVKVLDSSDKSYPGRRGCPQIQFQISNQFRNSYTLAKRSKEDLAFKKKAHQRFYSEHFDSCSFCLITDGSNHSQLDRVINELISLQNIDYEVLICGPLEKISRFLQYSKIRVVDDSCAESDEIRAPINRKKAKLIKIAQYENLVIIHDRIIIDSKFIEGVKRYGNYFDVYNCRWCPVEEKDPEMFSIGTEFAVSDFPTCSFSYLRSSRFINRRSSHHSQYVNGACYILKKQVLERTRWPEHLNWGDMEDVYFSRCLEIEGYTISNDWNNRILSTTNRIPVRRQTGLLGAIKARLKEQYERAMFMLCYKSGRVD